MNCELNSASESSIRKSQFERYVTRIENGPAGDSMASNEKVSTTGPGASFNGTVSASIQGDLSICEPSSIRYLSFGELCDILGFESFLPNLQAGSSLAYVIRDRNSTMLFL